MARCLAPLIFLFVSCPASARDHSLAPVPAEIASIHFVVTIDGKSTPVMHAAVSLYFLNFVAGKDTTITVTAPNDDFWDAGIDVQPWRLDIRPERKGRVLTFIMNGPEKITIARPDDVLGDADMLCPFANPPEKNAPTAARPGLR